MSQRAFTETGEKLISSIPKTLEDSLDSTDSRTAGLFVSEEIVNTEKRWSLERLSQSKRGRSPPMDPPDDIRRKIIR